MLSQGRSVPDLLAMPPGDLLAWVEARLDDVADDPEWQALAYGCGIGVDVADANENAAARDDLATAAILIDDRLGRLAAKPADRSYYTRRAMGRRSALIAEGGPIAGDRARDPAPLEAWFFDRLDMTLAEAQAAPRDPERVSTVDFLRLASLKDRIRLVRRAGLDRISPRGAEIAAWYALQDSEKDGNA